MSKILKEVLKANKSHAEAFGEKSKLSMPPARQFAILRCGGGIIIASLLAAAMRLCACATFALAPADGVTRMAHYLQTEHRYWELCHAATR